MDLLKKQVSLKTFVVLSYGPLNRQAQLKVNKLPRAARFRKHY